MVKFDVEWKCTEYLMWHKMTWMINMCDKLFFIVFFHLKLIPNVFQGINEKIWIFFIFDWRFATLNVALWKDATNNLVNKIVCYNHKLSLVDSIHHYILWHQSWLFWCCLFLCNCKHICMGNWHVAALRAMWITGWFPNGNVLEMWCFSEKKSWLFLNITSNFLFEPWFEPWLRCCRVPLYSRSDALGNINVRMSGVPWFATECVSLRQESKEKGERRRWDRGSRPSSNSARPFTPFWWWVVTIVRCAASTHSKP